MANLPPHVQRAIAEHDRQEDGPRKSKPLDPKFIWGGLALLAVFILFLVLESKQSHFRTYERGSGETTVLLFHGYGASGDDLVGLAEQIVALTGPSTLRWIVVEAPHAMGVGHRTWYRTEQEQAELMVDLHLLIEELKDEGLRSDQIVVAGFSMGAMVAFDLAIQEGPLGGVILLAGQYDHSPGVPVQNLAPAFMGHGRTDNRVGFSHSTRLAATMEAAGLEHQLIAFDGAHTIPPVVIQGMANWVQQQFGE